MADDEFTKGDVEDAKGAKVAGDVQPPETPEVEASEEKGKDGKEEPSSDAEKVAAGVKEALGNISLQELLRHPVLGPILNSWSDKVGNAQAATAVNTAKTSWDEETALKVLEERFESMSDEDLGHALKNPETAAAFANLIDRRNKVAEGASEEAVAKKGQVYGYGVQVAVYTEMLEGSGLSAEKKEALKADRFTHLGAPGIIAWGAAIQEALLEHESDAKARTLLEEKWEAHLEEKEGVGGASRENTDVSNGRPEGPITADMLKGMTPQEIIRLPQEQINKALKAQATKAKR